MKILKISFKNLNSLKGEHCIDLEGGLLGEAGIFSITGPTGAGKSTILDAITLALFGKAARYEKESNPGEMMTRGTGECSAEVLFECGRGRYLAKWYRYRARQNPSGRLQSPSREVSQADSGEILAEKLREADQLIESLTGLDYHRFLRSVLLAQGRFKEFLDADDNERGELLEKITGTEIYSLISKKAYEFERNQTKAIEAATLKLGGVTLKTEEELLELKQQQASESEAIQKQRAELVSIQKKLQQFERHQQLVASLKTSKQRLEQWQVADQAFAPSRERLARHEATQVFQPALIEIDGYRQSEQSARKKLQALVLDAQKCQNNAAQTLAATAQFVQQQLQAQIKEIADTDAQRSKSEAAHKAISTWLEAHEGDRAIETILPELRTLGEAVRQSQLALERGEKEFESLQADLRKNESAQAAQQTAVDQAERALKQAQQAAQAARTAFTAAADEKSISEWQALEKSQRAAEQAAQALQSQRLQWQQQQSELTSLHEQVPPLQQALSQAKQSLATAEAQVAKERSILEDKQKIWAQARLIAKLETHRAALKPNEACPLCGSREHPYAEHLDSDEDANQQAVQAQKKQLAEAEKALSAQQAAHTRLDEKFQSLQQQITKVKAALTTQVERLTALATTAAYSGAIDDDKSFAHWLSQCAATHKETEVKLEQLATLDQAQRQAQEELTRCDTAHRLCAAALKSSHEQHAELSKKLAQLREEQAKSQQSTAERLLRFNQKLGPTLEAATAPAQTLSRTQSLEKQLAHYQAQREAQAQEQRKLNEIQTRLKALQESRARLEEEQAHWKQEIQSFDALAEPKTLAPTAIASHEAQRRSNCQSALDAARLAEHARQQQGTQVETVAQQLKTAQDSLSEALRPTPFDSIDELLAARLSQTDYKTLNDKQNQLKLEREQLRGRIAQIEEALEQSKAQALITAEAAEALQTQAQAIEETISVHNKRLGEIQLLLEQDAQARIAQASLIQEIKTLEKEARPWIELSALIGSASGDKFSKFAQGLTLSQLLALANQHLLDLNDRYQIQRTDPSELGLQIVDRYQADTIRPTRSLSGGESFLVSLALALGLSDLAGSNTRIESLFIDEGFGSLDTDTLDTALAALENLRMSNRTIGIISHVDALKQRISAQVRVEKASNGYGTLSLING